MLEDRHAVSRVGWSHEQQDSKVNIQEIHFRGCGFLVIVFLLYF